MVFICAKDTNDNKITLSNEFQDIELQLPLLYGTFNTELAYPQTHLLFQNAILIILLISSLSSEYDDDDDNTTID